MTMKKGFSWPKTAKEHKEPDSPSTINLRDFADESDEDEPQAPSNRRNKKREESQQEDSYMGEYDFDEFLDFDDGSSSCFKLSQKRWTNTHANKAAAFW